MHFFSRPSSEQQDAKFNPNSLVSPELIALLPSPSKFRSPLPLLFRPYAVFPSVAADVVASRPANHRHLQLVTNESKDIRSEVVFRDKEIGRCWCVLLGRAGRARSVWEVGWICWYDSTIDTTT